MQSEIILAIVELFLYFFLGSIAARLRAIKEEEISRWSTFIVKYIYSLYIFHTMVIGFEVSTLKELWPLPLLAIGMMLTGALLSLPLQTGLKNSNPQMIRSFRNICAMNNFGFLPIIIIGRLWGEEGLSRLFVMLLGSYTGYWTIGILLFGGRNSRDILRKLLNPSTIAILTALFFKGTTLHRFIPPVLMDFTGKIGSGAVPLILTLIGANLWFSLSTFSRKGIWNLFYYSLIRNFLIPAILIGLLFLLPISNRVFQIAAIVALMPASTMSSVLSRIYGGDPEFTSQAAVVTHILALITVPFGLILLNIG